ncbi:hypothetical protein [Geodermatophilus sp. URMC 64]
MESTTKRRRWGTAAGLVAAGALAGGIVAGTLSAGADQGGTGAAGSTAAADRDGHRGERPLTGDTRDRVEAAVLAEYPGATIVRTETDSEGVYESHVVTADGQQLIVQVGEDFAVTGTQDDHHGRR